jgi:hypothetical protein
MLCPLETEDGTESWDRNARWSRDVLEHIMGLLFALANLADLAAGAPFHSPPKTRGRVLMR